MHIEVNNEFYDIAI